MPIVRDKALGVYTRWPSSFRLIAIFLILATSFTVKSASCPSVWLGLEQCATVHCNGVVVNSAYASPRGEGRLPSFNPP